MSGLAKFAYVPGLRRGLAALRPSHPAVRLISTSKKNEDPTATVTEGELCPPRPDEKKNWMSYGFSITDEEHDKNTANALSFFGISVFFVFGGFLLAYRPDYQLRDWAQREAHLELRRRESMGLPHVDPNFLPLDKIRLPTDEELGDTEIII